jgi:hypothetical protein
VGRQGAEQRHGVGSVHQDPAAHDDVELQVRRQLARVAGLEGDVLPAGCLDTRSGCVEDGGVQVDTDHAAARTDQVGGPARDVALRRDPRGTRQHRRDTLEQRLAQRIVRQAGRERLHDDPGGPVLALGIVRALPGAVQGPEGGVGEQTRPEELSGRACDSHGPFKGPSTLLAVRDWQGLALIKLTGISDRG